MQLIASVMSDINDNVSEQLLNKSFYIKQKCNNCKYTHIRRCNDKEFNNEKICIQSFETW